MAGSVDAEEKARVDALKKHAETTRARELAIRKARSERAKSEPSLIVHGPAKS